MPLYSLTWDPNPVSEQVSLYLVHASFDGEPFELVGKTDKNSFEYQTDRIGVANFALQAVNYVGVGSLGGSSVATPSAPAVPTFTVLGGRPGGFLPAALAKAG